MKKSITKNYDDRLIWKSVAALTFLVAVVLGLIAYHSKLFVEPELRSAVVSLDNVAGDSASLSITLYKLIDSPHIFGGYKYFDRGRGDLTRMALMRIEKIRSENGIFSSSDIPDLKMLLERREQASHLTRHTMIFFLLVSAISIFFLIYEARRTGKK